MWCWFREVWEIKREIMIPSFHISRFAILIYNFPPMYLARLSGCLPAIALVLSLPTQAAEWSLEPRIFLKTGYNDNTRLTTAIHDPVWETKLSPSVIFGVEKANQGLFGDIGFAIRRFAGGSGRESSRALDREDYHLETKAYHQTRRDIFRGNINYTVGNALEAELDETGNVVPNSATRNRFILSPSWSRTLSDQLRLNLGYQFSTVTYSDDPGISNLVESRSTGFSSSLVRQFTPRTQGSLSASTSSFKPETGSASSTTNIQAGLSRNFSETLSASFLAGLRETTSDTFTGFCIGGSPESGGTLQSCRASGGSYFPTAGATLKNSGAVFSTSITKTLKAGSISASLSRSSNPSSSGEILDTTRLTLSGEHRFTEILRSSLTIEYNERETIVDSVGLPVQGKRTLLRIRPVITWQWSREWELVGEYDYMRNTNVLSANAIRNALYFSLNYRPTKISLSR